MAKPDPALLNPARYPFVCGIETRYRDVDSNYHLNNGVLASLLEEGRVRFHRASQFGKLASDPQFSAMVASVTIDYLGEGSWPELIEMHVAVSRIGNSSYDLQQLITQQGRAITAAHVTMVRMKDGKPLSIADVHRTNAEPWMLRP